MCTLGAVSLLSVGAVDSFKPCLLYLQNIAVQQLPNPFVLCILQAIRTTTNLLEAVIAQAVPAGLSAEVADSLARQRCEATPVLSAVTWALRQVSHNLLVAFGDMGPMWSVHAPCTGSNPWDARLCKLLVKWLLRQQ
jgi:hypothetical protein